jgi:two-component system phosphate regulon response regulator PhoB
MRLLILEDDPKLQAILSHHLIVAGHEVRAAASLKQASSSVDGAPVDMIIADWRAADGACGGELCRSLRKAAKHPALHIILINAPQNANERAAQDCLPKPFDLGRLMASVRSAIQDLHARKAA